VSHIRIPNALTCHISVSLHSRTPGHVKSDHGPRVDHHDNNVLQKAALTPWVSRGDSSVVISTITFRVIIIHDNYYARTVCSHTHELIFLHDMAPCFTVLNPVHLLRHVTVMPAPKYQQVGTVSSKTLQSSTSARNLTCDRRNTIKISGFRRGSTELFRLLSYYATWGAHISKGQSVTWPLKIGPLVPKRRFQTTSRRVITQKTEEFNNTVFAKPKDDQLDCQHSPTTSNSCKGMYSVNWNVTSVKVKVTFSRYRPEHALGDPVG
jgi:hypothetical protein